MSASTSLLAGSSTLPTWITTDTCSKVDIVLVQGLPARTVTPGAIRRAKKEAIVHLVELGITRDTRYRETMESKSRQHDKVEQAIQARGWTTKRHTVLFGRTGTVYINTLTALRELGMDTAVTTRLLKRIQTHLCDRLYSTYRTRRHLEYSKDRTIPQTGGPRG